MSTQREGVMVLAKEQKKWGRSVFEVLQTLGIKRSTYYRWKNQEGMRPIERGGAYPLTPEEERMIKTIKEERPGLRHRQIQGVLQGKGVYLSFSSIYNYLKCKGQVEPYARRRAPWEHPRYEVWQRNVIGGCDWTKFKIAHLRWYLLTVIDFFSRRIIAFDIVPTVNASHIKGIYQVGLKAQDIPLQSEGLPEFRVDRGSPNTSWVTKEFFEIIGAELSYARVRRPTDNALTERFYGTIKQEEIYLVGSYPDEPSAREEIGHYIGYYNGGRPHQALMNFTPDYVHQVTNKTALLQERKAMKTEARKKRREYWINFGKKDSLNSPILSHL